MSVRSVSCSYQQEPILRFTTMIDGYIAEAAKDAIDPPPVGYNGANVLCLLDQRSRNRGDDRIDGNGISTAALCAFRKLLFANLMCVARIFREIPTLPDESEIVDALDNELGEKHIDMLCE